MELRQDDVAYIFVELDVTGIASAAEVNWLDTWCSASLADRN